MERTSPIVLDGDTKYHDVNALRELMRRDARFEWVDMCNVVGARQAQILVRRRNVGASRDSQEDVALRALLESDSIPQYVWPAASPMQQWIITHGDTFAGKTVLELGCGTGVIGFTVAQYAKLVVLTDCSAVSLAMTQESLTRNALNNCLVAALSWGRDDQMAHIKEVCRITSFDIVVGSDVFYFSSALKSGLATARSAFGPLNSHDAIFLCGSVTRSERMETDLDEIPGPEGFQLSSFLVEEPFRLYCWRLALP